MTKCDQSVSRNNRYGGRVIVMAGVGLCILIQSVCFAQESGRLVRARYPPSTERWAIEEITLRSSTPYKNAFHDVTLKATFSHGLEAVTVAGFYDGGSVWRVRFMPGSEGGWTFRMHSSDPGFEGVTGHFNVRAAGARNHGPVRVAKTYHFSYADGTPLFVLGTTMYNWINRDDKLQEQTLRTLALEPFNKVRFLLFPKWYVYNRTDPQYFPFVRRADCTFDLDRFDVRYFHKLELRISELQRMGIQADIILFHPYDHWGFDAMDEEHDEQYLRYVAARLSAYQNVWWTMANEYDLFDASLAKGERPPKDWDHLGRTLATSDPYHHLIGNHDIATWYDASKSWITHVVDQDGTHHPDLAVPIGRNVFHKPVLVDEYGYEGNNGESWGDFSGREIVRQHWELTMAGGYGSHGETFVHPGGILWWSDGGTLIGDSPSRLAFLKSIMVGAPFQELLPSPELVADGTALAEKSQYLLFYFEHAGQAQLSIPGTGFYKVDLIDPWLMKIYPMGTVAAGVHAISIHMVPCLLRFIRIHGANLKGSLPTLADRMDSFAGELPTPVTSTPFQLTEPHLTPQYTLNLLLLIPAARETIQDVLPGLKLDGINPAHTLQEVIDNPKNGISADKAAQIEDAISRLRPY